MYQSLGNIKLRSGETVEAGVVRGPDLDWSPRLQKLLGHKGDPWNWQNAQVLESDHGLSVNFYLLHRGGDPFANVMSIEVAGVGHFGHVWTEPADRKQGASSSLMRLQLQDFVERGGQALYLGTAYDSVSYQMYASFGFSSVAAGSGYMAYYTKPAHEFEAAFFAPGECVIEALSWQHWPTSAPLFLGNYPGLIRSAPLQLIGQASSEGPFLPALLDAQVREQKGETPTVLALCNPATKAVVGLAAWAWHPIWPESCVVDCYCHPDHWAQAADLLAALERPTADRTIVYVDSGNEAKAALFTQAGFKPIATLPNWLATDQRKQAWTDVVVMAV